MSLHKIFKYQSASLLVIITFCLTPICYAADLISLFPIENYDQKLETWINPQSTDYDKPLLTAEQQHKHYSLFYNRYFGSLSPWNAGHVNKILQLPFPGNLKTYEINLINKLSNSNKPADQIGYGENFRPHTEEWIKNIKNNIQLSQFDMPLYQSTKRAIAVDNLYLRVLPTDTPHFYDYKLAGQGYPFDNLQMSAVWAGTPLYVLGKTHDQAWSFVLTPDAIGWVKTNGIAFVSETFVRFWTMQTKKQLAAIVETRTGLQDDENGQFLFSAYVGTVLPAEQTTNGFRLMVPVADANRQAVVRYASVSKHVAHSMPMVPTMRHFAYIIKTLKGRPYGWGSLYFYNDCSAELKSLFTPFGIWLPRHSSDQVHTGKIVDMSLASAQDRLKYLTDYGHPFMTIIYIGGHIMLYTGNQAASRADDQNKIAMTYQDIWGLKPNPPSRRAVIGKSIFIPLLLQYPEDPGLESLARKQFFQVSYLDALPNEPLGDINLEMMFNP